MVQPNITGATGLLTMEATLCVVLSKKFVDEVFKMFNGGCSFILFKKKKEKEIKKQHMG